MNPPEVTVSRLGSYSINDDYSSANVTIPFHPCDIGVLYDAQRTKKMRQGMLAVPSVKVTQSVVNSAARLSIIGRDLVGVLAWHDRGDLSKRHRSWREISLESVRAGCNVFLLDNLTDNEVGLDKNQMRLISGVTKQASLFFHDFCKFPNIFRDRDRSEIPQPIRTLLGRFLRKQFPNETELHLHFDVMCQDFFQGCITDLLTPAVITRILLNLEFPYGGEEEDETGKAEINAMCEKYPAECDELGEALIGCVDILVTASKDRLIDASSGLKKIKQMACKAGISIGTSFLSKFKRTIGGYIFATVNAALRSEGSKVLPIIELWLQRTKNAPEIIDEVALRHQLDIGLRKDLTRLIKYVISEKPEEKAFIKEQAEKIINEITPTIVDLVWNKQAMPIAHLLFYYIPKAPCLQIPEVPTKEVINKTSGSQRLEALAIRFVQDYLMTMSLGNSKANWNGVFLSSIKIGIRRAFAEKNEESPSALTIHENTLELGFIIAAVNRFLCKSIENKHEFTLSPEEIYQPLVDFIQSLMDIKYPGNEIVQQEIKKISIGLVNTFFDTILDPVVISNLILKIKLDKTCIPQPEKGVEEMEEMKGYDGVGLEVVRLLRTIFTLGTVEESLGYVDKSIAGIARKHTREIGSKLAQSIHAAAKSNDIAIFDMLEKVLWRKSKENEMDSAPIFFDGWIEDREELQGALSNWIESQLLPFISLVVSSQRFWFSGLIEKKLSSIVSLVTQKIFSLIWYDENKAIRVLFLHYLLPVIKPRLLDFLTQRR